MKTKTKRRELNQIKTTLLVFMESYNLGIPKGYPQASVKMLKQFQAAHPILFQQGYEWSVDRHRKRLMDWLFSHRDAA